MAGDLVTYKGETWSARVAIDPAGLKSAPSPTMSGIYWSKVDTSYAIVPGYTAEYAPLSVYNTGVNAQVLGGDPGLVSSKIKLGDRIFLDGAPGLDAGTYTLLPRRYAILPGAFLVTPKSGGTFAKYSTGEGNSYTSGYFVNAFNQPSQATGIRSLFEIASPAVIAGRAEYEVLGANEFITRAAERLNVDAVQRLPIDSGSLSFQGNSALRLEGTVLTKAFSGGRGASVDVSSDADIHIIGGSGSAPVGATVVLNSDLLNSWGAESLLIGGLRRTTSEGVSVDVRTSSVTLDNPGGELSSPEITLVSKAALTVTAGSKIASSGTMSRTSEDFLLSGDGTLLRVSGDTGAAMARSSTTGSVLPLMTIGAGASISGAGVILDSSYATSLSPTAILSATALTLGGGQISIVLSPSAGGLTGSVISPHLTLSGSLLTYVQSVNSLKLSSYRTIDIYGAGTFGSSTMGSLNLFATGIRGYDRGTVTLIAGTVTLANPSGGSALAAPALPLSGDLRILSETMNLGANAFSIAGYQSLDITASDGVLATADGSLALPGTLSVTTPMITGFGGVSYDVTAAGSVSLLPGVGTSGVSGGLGASLGFTGSSILAHTAINLPSGSLVLHALGGGVTVGGELTVDGTAQAFYDVTRYADAGRIELTSDTGDVTLNPGSLVSIAAADGGGNAGSAEIRAPAGSFVNNGSLLGSAAAGFASGSFLLDASSIVSFANINNPLESGGFFEERNIRVRTGSVTMDSTAHARSFSLSTDQGGITVSGTGLIDASGLTGVGTTGALTGVLTGGSIALAARDNVTVQSGALLTVAATQFSSAGKGGAIRIEAGAQQDGTFNTAALLDLQAGSTLDLSVASFVAGGYTSVGSSAFNGQFQGTLHLRALRSGNDVRVDAIESTITGASSVVVEAYKLYDQTSGILNTTLRGTINTEAATFMTAGETAMRTKLLTTGDPLTSAALSPLLVIVPGVEIINRTGDLTLGLANPTGSTNAQALSSADWDFSTFRYGTNSAPGILTLRAKGDLVFNNTLSDGFTPVAASTANGNSSMWLATLKTVNTSLPLNTQSWSFRLSAGADLGAADFRSVLSTASLTAGKGSLLVGEFYPAIPNAATSGTAPATGTLGLTANTIRISTDATNRGTRYEVIRTGTGDITISAGRDVQLRNQFATIYTAGVALPTPTTIFVANDFVAPILNKTPSQSGTGVTLGAIQQTYAAVWSLGGGDVSIFARENIGHYTKNSAGLLIVDSSRQMPTNWLYRRGYVDDSGQFASNGGIDGVLISTRVTDPATSTAWWIDFSNFFEGVGALGGGDVSLTAGNDIVNVDAFAPTNARMAGRNPLTGINLAPDAAKLLELGGGDVTVRAGNNIDGGVYYVERGAGSLVAGGSITTNSARSPQLGILDSSSTAVYDSATWLPTTLMVGRSHFDVSALKDVLLGPVTNPFLLPQGLNNKFWYKTYFNTFSSDSGVDVASFGGSVTHRVAATLPGAASPDSILNLWFTTQNLFNGGGSAYNASNFQPWLRLAEVDLSAFGQVFSLGAPNLKSSAFSGDVNLVGSLTLFPSATGTLELVASGSIVGLQSTGVGVNAKGESASVWTSSTVNVSDADPLTFPGTTSPIGYQKFSGRVQADALMSGFNPYSIVNVVLQETGSYLNSSIDVQRALHSETLLHAGDSSPIRLYAAGGSLTGLTLFSPKVTLAMAEKDITDIAFYIQNVSPDDVSIVSAGRDIIPYNENAPMRALASDASQGNVIGDPTRRTTTDVLSNALSGDIQINGSGVLEVLAGRDLDLGTGPNYADGTAVGITSIGNYRNPFLPFEGASLVVMAGVEGQAGGPALGLAGSNLDFTQISSKGSGSFVSKELEDVAALQEFFALLRQAADEYETTGSYATGFSAIDGVFGSASGSGEIYTRARDIRTTTGGAITIAAPSGGLTMASDIFGNPGTPPGIVTEYGGEVSIFTNGSVNIGRTRIFTLRGGDMTIWSSTGDIAAGTASKTVVTAPPTRVVIDTTSADVATDLGGLATGGGIGVLASVKGVPPGNVSLIAPLGTVDAGDAGIQATGNLRIAASQVLNADNISTGGTASGVPSAPTVAAPNIGGLTSASSSSAAANSAANQVANQASQQQQETIETPSTITVEVLGYGGGEDES
ncbi:MAG: filamentous hemagglutinin family protein [Verrucomicrobiae bacterium]